MQQCGIDFNISLTWALVICFIATLVFIYCLVKGGKDGE